MGPAQASQGHCPSTCNRTLSGEAETRVGAGPSRGSRVWAPVGLLSSFLLLQQRITWNVLEGAQGAEWEAGVEMCVSEQPLRGCLRNSEPFGPCHPHLALARQTVALRSAHTVPKL